MNKPKIHIYFNGGNAVLPANNDWEKFANHEELRVFLICAESWKRNGFDVCRMTTRQEDGQFEPTEFRNTGEVSKSWNWYKREHWQVIAKAKDIASQDEKALTLFGTFDVVNFGFTPPPFLYMDLPESNLPQCFTFQAEHFSMGLFAANYNWLSLAEKILLLYDDGVLPSLNRTYVSDETILRQYAPYKIYGRCSFPSNTTAATQPLLHFSRSSLRSTYEAIPLSP